MQRLFGIDWTDPALYALVLNTARVQVADCVEHIVKGRRSRRHSRRRLRRAWH